MQSTIFFGRKCVNKYVPKEEGGGASAPLVLLSPSHIRHWVLYGWRFFNQVFTFDKKNVQLHTLLSF